MSTQGTIRRYTLEIEKINAVRFPSFNDIQEFLKSQGLEISQRTLQRDIEDIRFEFGIDIQYNRANNGYYIESETSPNLESFLRFLEVVNTAQLLTESLQEGKDALEYISFEAQGTLKGIEHLKPLLTAIRQHRKISFTHYNFVTDKTTSHTLSPYLLKEYQKRWYIFGQLPNKELRTFGIDRMEQLEVKPETFQPKKKFDAFAFFENVIGLTYTDGNLQEVVLQFTPFQGKYIKSLPLHHSQQIVQDNQKAFIIRLNIIPNFEFTQKLLMHGERVKVLQPEWLAQEMKKNYQAALKQYS
jgi:predicted DNA-binding transcriptional regulator YafY